VFTTGTPTLATLTTTVGTTALQMEMNFDGMADSMTGVLRSPPTEAFPDGDPTQIQAHRKSWSPTNPATTYATRHHFMLTPGGGGPSGIGFGNFTVSAATGNLTLSGKLADGSTITGTTFVGGNDTKGRVLVYLPLYGNQGSCIGFIDINPSPTPPLDNVIQGSLSWMKPPVPASSKDTLYQDGFGPDDYNVTGSAYAPPAPGALVLGLTPVLAPELNASFTAPEVSQAIRISNPKATGRTNTVFVPPYKPGTDFSDSQNPFKLKLTLNATTGAFSGTFTLPANPELRIPARTPTFYGQITEGQAAGFVILGNAPEEGQPFSQVPKQSYPVNIAP
jgi:hypothetical protein